MVTLLSRGVDFGVPKLRIRSFRLFSRWGSEGCLEHPVKIKVAGLRLVWQGGDLLVFDGFDVTNRKFGRDAVLRPQFSSWAIMNGLVWVT
jgi:hypothetical protein